MTTQTVGQVILDEERSLDDRRVEAMWPIVYEDILREIPSARDHHWDPGYLRKKVYTDDIWRALGSPEPGSTVVIDSALIQRTMRAAHKPATDMAHDLGLDRLTQGRTILMHCNATTQRQMTEELITATGAKFRRA